MIAAVHAKFGKMFSNQGKKKTSRIIPKNTSGHRLYSIAAWPKLRAFVGDISLGGKDYQFSYAPSRAEAVNNLLQLTGRLTITDPRGRARALNSVRITLANTQGGIGTGPARKQMIASDALTGAQVTSQPKQPVAGETEKPAGEKPNEPTRARGSLPVTENTGPTSYCGVLYFHFEPLDDTAKTLHGLYCYVVDALYGEQRDQKLAMAAIGELNRVLG
jgi:hypothetical protein